MTLLDVDGLTKTFGRLAAVDDVDLQVDRGTIHSIIGPNGAGKSTLFDLVSGLLKPTAGTVLFDGEDVTGLRPHRIARRGIARSFQITDVFGGLTAIENVRIAAQVGNDRRGSVLRRADALEDVETRARETLADIGLADRETQRADDFAYGDRRKLEIGLAIANDPALLLLDEPTAGMGRQDTTDTMGMIRELAARREFTLLLIEHDLEVVMSVSDVVTVLQDGRVIAGGTPGEIRADETVQEAYLGGALE